MTRIRGRDTKPEMRVRRMAHGMGFRYRLHRSDLPGSLDLVFPLRRKVLFVYGSFGHRHLYPYCKVARLPKSKLDFSGSKLETNRERDERNVVLREEIGWDVLII